MTLDHFHTLDEGEQMEAVWNGVELGERFEGEYKISLIQIDSFYVELFHHVEHNVLKRIHSFSDTDHLQPYVNTITLSKQ